MRGGKDGVRPKLKIGFEEKPKARTTKLFRACYPFHRRLWRLASQQRGEGATAPDANQRRFGCGAAANERPSEMCLRFAFNADCDDDDDNCVVSPGEPLAR